MTSLTTSVCLTPGTNAMCWASCTCLLKSFVRYVDSEVGAWRPLAAGILPYSEESGFEESMESQDRLRKGGVGYVRSKMKSDPRVPGTSPGVTVVKGGGRSSEG